MGDVGDRLPQLQVPLLEAVDDFLLIPQVIASPDHIYLSEKKYEGRPVVLFSKRINGTITIVSYASRKHHDLIVQTLYASEKSLSTPPSGISPRSQTSETTSGTALATKISNSDADVNTTLRQDEEKGVKFSMKDGQSVSYEALVAKPDMEVTLLTQEVPMKDGKIDRAAVVKAARENVAALGNPKNTGSLFFARVDDMETDVLVRTKSVRHGLMRKGEASDATAAAEMHLGDILSRAVKVNMSKDGSKTILVGLAIDGEKQYAVRFVVENDALSDIGMVSSLYSARSRRKELSQRQVVGNQEDTLTKLWKAPTITIRELLELVKDSYDQMWKWITDYQENPT